MPFKNYKASHGGRGPVEDLYSKATSGHGLFGQLGLHQERELTDQLIHDLSNNEEFKGMEGMLEAGKSPLTREQHAAFRSGIVQAALDRRVFNAGLEEYQAKAATARTNMVSKEDAIAMDNFDAMANHANRLAMTGHTDKAMEVFGNVLASFGAYNQRNEEQRLELESSEDAQRETIRKEIQGTINSNIVAPYIQDSTAYRTISAQLEGQSGDQVAPPSLVSAVLEYSMAELRQSDDGNWSFALGPIGLQDTNLPAMTYSQIRNRLNQAHQGHAQSLRDSAAPILEEARKRKFAVNGDGVDDIMFPLANEVYRQQEKETAPPSVVPPSGAQPSGKETPKDVVRDTIIGLGDLYQFARRNWAKDFESMFGTEPEPHMTPGDARPGNTRRSPQSVSGQILRPTND